MSNSISLLTTMARRGINSKKGKNIVNDYSVIEIIDENSADRVFECIPDSWFTDAAKSNCFWPPMSGPSIMKRAINCDRPNDDWNSYTCKLVKGGFSKFPC